MRLTIAPPTSDPTLYREVLERFGVRAEVQRSRADRQARQLRLTLSCEVQDLDQGPDMVTALLERPEILVATLERR